MDLTNSEPSSSLFSFTLVGNLPNMNKISSLFKLSILMLIITISSCKKTSNEALSGNANTNAIPFQTIQNCHKASNPYPSQITNNILGNWQWEKTFSPWTQKTTIAPKHVLIHFNDASTYHITESGLTVATGVWSLKQLSNSEWEIQLSEEYAVTQGVISLCNDELVLSNTYLDGPANYFVRKSE